MNDWSFLFSCDGPLAVVLAAGLFYLHHTNKPVAAGYDSSGKARFAKKYRFVILALATTLTVVVATGLIKILATLTGRIEGLAGVLGSFDSSLVQMFGPIAIIDAVRRADFTGSNPTDPRYFWPVVDGAAIGLFLVLRCPFGP